MGHRMLVAQLVLRTVLLTAAAPSSNEVAWVALGSGEALAPMLRALVARDQKMSGTPLADDEARRRLVGTDNARIPDEAALTHMLADARDREARFDTVGANAVRREVLAAFETAVWPSAALRRLAAQAAQDIAAAMLNEGKTHEAAKAAREAVGRFPDVPIDAQRYSPAVRAQFATASSSARAMASLTIGVDAPGTLVVDGRPMGEVVDGATLELPPGRYRVWLEHEGDATLPERVELSPSGGRIAIATRLAGRVDLWPVLSLRCDEDCVKLLADVGGRLGVSRVVGVRSEAVLADRLVLLHVSVATGVLDREETVRARDVVAVSPRAERPSARWSRFNALYLVPFGGGQLAQGRVPYAAAYFATEIGLLAWNAVTVRAHDRAAREGNLADESDLRSRRNLSASLAAGAIVAGVVEALLVGWLGGRD